MKLFGKAKKAAPTPVDAIGKMKDTIDMLEKRSDYLQKKIDNEQNEVKKKLAKKDKKGFGFIFLVLLRFGLVSS